MATPVEQDHWESFRTQRTVTVWETVKAVNLKLGKACYYLSNIMH